MYSVAQIINMQILKYLCKSLSHFLIATQKASPKNLKLISGDAVI